MRAHLFIDGGGMVTGTHDKLAAQQALVDEWLDKYGDPDDGLAVLNALRVFPLNGADLQTGRIVPESPKTREYSGYAWWWRSGYTLGKRGVTRAVVWNG